MHRADAGADDRSAQERRAPAPLQGDLPAEPGDENRGADRKQRGGEVVTDQQVRLVGEHGDEVRGPDAEARDDRGKLGP